MESAVKSSAVRISPATLRRAKIVAVHYNMPVSELVDQAVLQGIAEREQAIRAAAVQPVKLVR
ncbi:hypothetical protein M0D68_06795 [Paraburkholderia sp. SEWSISQ10-3 4]|nr:hypothetical protein [Paraburkholderia aspalathi]MDN7170575.1 hypothetical protein [Paraburkholderia sp. SEWSISQ10-3 4]MDQ6500214.1 hypothetical protein [Paraburkholderia aspalathi]